VAAAAAQLEMGLIHDQYLESRDVNLDIKTAFPAFSIPPSAVDAEGERRLEQAAGYYRKALGLADGSSFGFDAVGIKAEACYRLGLYAEHQGDKKQSLTLFEQAAELGHVWGQFTLAEMIGEQVEVLRASRALSPVTLASLRKHNLRRACKWYTKAAEQVSVCPGGACPPPVHTVARS
jgi:hypothetical protein